MLDLFEVLLAAWNGRRLRFASHSIGCASAMLEQARHCVRLARWASLAAPNGL